MSVALQVMRYVPAVNPAYVILKAVRSGSYVAGGDPINLAPSSWTDPNGVGIIGYPTTPPSVPPGIDTDNFTGASIGGYSQIVPGTTLQNFKLMTLAPGGAEIAATTYPAGVLAGDTYIRVAV